MAEQLRLLQAQFSELMKRVESGNGASVTARADAVTEAPPLAAAGSPAVPPPATATPPAIPVVSSAVAAAASRGPGSTEAMVDGITNNHRAPSVVVPLQAAMLSEQTPSSAAPSPDPLECIELANGRILSFSKKSIPDPPSISFAKDLPRLVRIWDDGASEWTPADAVLRIQGEPIALKYWPDLYRYGKSHQWSGIKGNWTKWQVRPYIRFWNALLTARHV